MTWPGYADYTQPPRAEIEALRRALDRAAAFQIEVDHLRSRVAELESQAVQDPLTGLLNRRGGHAALVASMKRSLRTGDPVSVILLDVDHFKALNDRLGHAHGDAVLRAVAGAITRTLRATDVGIRWGGEEFVIVTENDARGATVLASRLRRIIERLYEPPVTASLGVAAFDGRITDGPMGHTIEAADKAMYAAKNAGRNLVWTAGSGMKTR